MARRTLLVGFLLLCSVQYLAAGTDIKAEDLVQKHLASLGSQQVLSAAKTRVIEAGTTYKILVGGSGAIDGKAVIASSEDKSRFLFKLNTVEYKGEQFICDGKHTSIAGTYADKRRSELGEFLRVQDVILRDGLLGGELTTGWLLLREDLWKGRLGSVSTKTVDGQDLYRVEYKARGSGDLDIELYFDPKTFQHVMTTYRITRSVGMGLHGELSSAQRQQGRYLVEERFSGHESLDGLTLPTHYDLRYTEETENGFTKSVEWQVVTTRVMNNIGLDPRNFDLK